MNTKGFTGGAGTGKTTSLLRELDAHLAAHPLAPGQRVLALTFMHGSRHRLGERLAKSSARRHCECMTLDRFAWDICRRWRSRLRAGGGLVPLGLDEPDYDATCEAAKRLLGAPDVAKWVAARYPVIVLDEFQDFTPVRVALAQCLQGSVDMLVAADDFQNLNRTDESPGVAWLRGLNVCEELTINRRTADANLIAAARALRDGMAIPTVVGTSFKLIGAPTAPLAASFISKTMAPAAGKDVVLLSAVRPGTSTWVDKVIELVKTKQYGVQKAGPVPIKWETTVDSLAESTIAALGITEGTRLVTAAAILGLPRGPVASQLNRWVDHQRRIMGRTEFGAAEVLVRVERAKQYVRSSGFMPQGGRRVMTIHQAKNREFPVVIVLWPLTLKGDAMLARRWLYNAITRAKRRAIVIVEDPKQERLNAPPFAYHASRSSS
ncbi:MAG: ATP-dependent helicase [Verrucomicrobia bacterium]|nr:ATP-dependent helicase [Verrucomicrobiota bacterium]